MFVLQFVLGGTLDEQVMIRLGALLPQQVLAEGEWWRLVTANFLHAGPLHLGANLLGLYVFGPFIANRLGQLRYLLLYFATGIGAMAFVTLVHGFDLARHLPLARPPPWAGDAQQLVVGASGSIMGLVGAAAAIFLRQWWRHRLPEQRQRLLLIALVLAFQTAFDLTTPQVSFAAHAAGAVCGLLLAAVLPFRDDTVLLPAPPTPAPEVTHGTRPA
jgi:rhomboid protease GluP